MCDSFSETLNVCFVSAESLGAGGRDGEAAVEVGRAKRDLSHLPAETRGLVPSVLRPSSLLNLRRQRRRLPVPEPDTPPRPVPAAVRASTPALPRPAALSDMADVRFRPGR